MSQALQVALWFVGITTALTALGQSVRWVWQVLRALSRLADDLTGEPARNGQAAQPGLLALVKSIQDNLELQHAELVRVREQNEEFERRLAALEAQMRPNGGGSLRDAVDRIEIQAAA